MDGGMVNWKCGGGAGEEAPLYSGGGGVGATPRHPFTWKPYPQEGGCLGATPLQGAPGQMPVQVRPNLGVGRPPVEASPALPSLAG